jgi:hypothetical protein
MMTLILGVVAGALAAVYWHDDLMRLRERAGRDYAGTLRERAADTLESLEASVGEGLDRARTTTTSTLRSWSRSLRGDREGTSAAAEGGGASGARPS